MKKYASLLTVLSAFLALAGCTPPPQPADAPAGQPAETPAPGDSYSEVGAQTHLNPIMLDPFTVESLHIGDLNLGHFNLYVKGGEPAVVRAWIGDEAASNVMVTKAEYEVDHHCAHLEVPQPLPPEARLWVELETPDGKRMKGSAELK